jgi:hypothetical protein
MTSSSTLDLGGVSHQSHPQVALRSEQAIDELAVKLKMDRGASRED